MAQTSLRVQRPVYQIDELNTVTEYEYIPRTFKQACRKKLRKCSAKSCILGTIPILKWLPKYNCKKNLVNDVLSGITVGIMNIPQGMAYAILGNLPPITGLYMGFFPVLMYFIFGTSRHVSVGTFAIVCLMTGQTVSRHSSEEYLADRTSRRTDDDTKYTSIQVATTVTFTVALMQMAMYIFGLGIIATLFSETLVNAFTCGSAFHVLCSQFKDLFGVPTPRRRGLFRNIFTIYDTCVALPKANIPAVILSAIFVSFLGLVNELLKPWLAKRTRIPFPNELVAVVVGTSASYSLRLHGKHATSIVGPVPTGLPKPALPVFALIPDIAADAFVITMVSYTISMSMALLFAQKLHYEVDANQELFALGMGNGLGCFFSCMPVCASLSRSMVQQTVGGVTQVASLVSCSLLLVVLLWIGPVLEPLPRCVLASIIVVALKRLLLQFKSFTRYWRLSSWDATVWLVTFFTTLLVAVDIGLVAGLLISLLTIFVQAQMPYSCTLGVVPNTDLYLDVKRYKGINEIEGFKIFHFSGGLNFATKASFRAALFKRTGFDPSLVLSEREDMLTHPSLELQELRVKCIILDFSALTYIDPSAVEMLRQLVKDYRELDISVVISGCVGLFKVICSCSFGADMIIQAQDLRVSIKSPPQFLRRKRFAVRLPEGTYLAFKTSGSS